MTEITCGTDTIETSHPDLIKRACHFAQKANIWRYEIIKRFGGVYFDTDIEPFRPIDDLVLDLNAFAVEGWRKRFPVLENAFFGAAPNHPWMCDLVEGLPSKDPTITLSMGIDYFTPTTRAHPEVTVLPPAAIIFIEPSNWTQAKLDQQAPTPADSRSILTDKTYAIHHWSSLWFPTGFQPKVPVA